MPDDQLKIGDKFSKPELHKSNIFLKKKLTIKSELL